MDYKDITVEAINDNSIMYDGTWQIVEGKALDYLKNITKDDALKIGVIDNKIRWMKKLNGKTEEPKPKVAKPMTPFDVRNKGAQAGGVLHDATKLAITKFGADVTTKEVFVFFDEIIRELEDRGF